MKRIIALIISLCLIGALLCSCAGSSRVYPTIDDDYRTFYQLLVGTYCDSDGDGMGDIQGLISKLDYINDGDPDSDTSLHMNGIWLLPIMTSPTYHKYDTSDYYNVDPQYGTLEDFAQLAQECNERNIALILDLSVNHTSNYHPWFKSACVSIGIDPCGEDECIYAELCREHNPYCEYYNFSPTPVSGWHPVKESSGWYYEGEYHAGMPDLNLDSELVREEIINICSFWLDYGIYGFRLDSLKSYYGGNLTKSAEFTDWLQTTLNQKYGSVYLVGELWTESSTQISRYYENSSIKSLFIFDMSAPQSNAITMAIRLGQGTKITNALLKWEDVEKSSETAINSYFLSNHDMTRSAGSLNRDVILEKQAAAIYLLMPGCSYVYYGEEIGMTGGSENDPNKRMPMVWSVESSDGITNPPSGATSKESPNAGVAEQLKDKDSLLRFYIEALKIKNAYPALARGKISSYDFGEKTITSYAVSYEDERYVVIHNVGTETLSLNIEDTSEFELLEVLAAGGEKPTLKDNVVTMPSYSTALLKI